jgi:hypothetical protein
MLRFAAVALPFVVCAAPCAADEPLPPPRLVQPPTVVYVQPLVVYRVSAYEHYQYQAVDRFGRWRPRVVVVGDEGRYLYNGAPYPWVINNYRSVSE